MYINICLIIIIHLNERKKKICKNETNKYKLAIVIKFKRENLVHSLKMHK